MLNRVWIIVFLFNFSSIYAQLTESFELSSVDQLLDWQGDIDHFIINDSQQLQLEAEQEGSSYLSTYITYPDMVEWNFYFKLNFAPSNSNKLQVFLYSSQSNLIDGDAYYLELGQNGSEDNLKFYRQVQNSKILLAQTSPGLLGNSPAEAKVQIRKSNTGKWTISVAYNMDDFLVVETEVIDNSLSIVEGYFGIKCDYTSTRKDKFIFDDFIISPPEQDTLPPNLESYEVVNSTTIKLVFNELLDPSTALDFGNYSIDNGIGGPIEIFFGDGENEIILELAKSIEPGTKYVLDISNVQDLAGNTINTLTEIILLDIPQTNSILINEILFNPYPDGDDYVEIYNNTDKHLSLERMYISNSSNERKEKITRIKSIAPWSFIVFSENLDALYEHYTIKSPENLIESALPAFNNKDGNVSLIWDMENPSIINSFDYTEDMHLAILDDNEGVSLERIDFNRSTQDIANWQSASSAYNYGTPGYQNSIVGDEMQSENEFSLKSRTFSPDNDGFEDILELDYRVSKPGFVLNMKVFSDRGNLIRNIASNSILGRSGLLAWDGVMDDGNMADMGIYILWLEIFDDSGYVQRKKISCVLAKQLN